MTAAATAEAEEEDELGEGLSAEALVRIQKARISVMQKQLHDAIDHGKEMDKKAASLEAEVRRSVSIVRGWKGHRPHEARKEGTETRLSALLLQGDR